MILQTIVILLPLFYYKINCTSDFCTLEKNPKICKENPHTGCSGTGTDPPMHEECINKQLIELTPELMMLLLSEHNSWRNALAAGNIKNFPSASRMMKMHWDKELALLAEKHVWYCVFEHDKCRATDKYPMSGQNIALKLYSHAFKNYEQIMKEMIAEWFEEYELVPKNEVRTLINDYHHSSYYGHFFVMARETNNAVGCALISMENKVLQPKTPYHFMLTCNYATTNIKHASVYDQGDPGSRCNSHGSRYKRDSNDCQSLCDVPIDQTTMEGNTSIALLETFKMCHDKSMAYSTYNQALGIKIFVLMMLYLYTYW